MNLFRNPSPNPCRSNDEDIARVTFVTDKGETINVEVDRNSIPKDCVNFEIYTLDNLIKNGVEPKGITISGNSMNDISSLTELRDILEANKDSLFKTE